MHLFFLADICISFRVAHRDGEVLVTDGAATAKNYMRCVPGRRLPAAISMASGTRLSGQDLESCMLMGIGAQYVAPGHEGTEVSGCFSVAKDAGGLEALHVLPVRPCRTRFWWDLAAWIPLDYIALAVLGDLHAGASLVARVPLLRLLRLVTTRSAAYLCHNLMWETAATVKCRSFLCPASAPELALPGHAGADPAVPRALVLRAPGVQPDRVPALVHAHQEHDGAPRMRPLLQLPMTHPVACSAPVQVHACMVPERRLAAPAQYVFYVTHWSACMFYFIASLHHLGQDTWIGRRFDDVLHLPLIDRQAGSCI